MCNCKVLETDILTILLVLICIFMIVCQTIMTIYIVKSYQKMTDIEKTIKRFE